MGIAARAQKRGPWWDFLNLGDGIVAPFFPQILTGQALVFAIPDLSSQQPHRTFKLQIIAANRPNVLAYWTIKQDYGIEPVLTSKQVGIAPFRVEPDDGHDVKVGVCRTHRGTTKEPAYYVMALPSPPIVVPGPTRVSVELVEDGGRSRTIGAFEVIFKAPPPLTQAERNALMARPNFKQAERVTFTCNTCKENISLYTALDLDRRPRSVPSEAIRIEEAPDVWSCSCGPRQDLRFLKAGMHDLLRSAKRRGAEPEHTFTPAYQRTAIDRLVADYLAIISAKPREELVQKFLEKNPIFWGFLSPIRILYKPPILTKKNADFAVLSSHRVLYLIEIEKPQTPLVKRPTGIHAGLQAGLNQIADWNVVVEDHRHALLKELGFREDEVHDVRYILIAGLAGKTSDSGLNTLRRKKVFQGVELICFDELAVFVQRFSYALTAV